MQAYPKTALLRAPHTQERQIAYLVLSIILFATETKYYGIMDIKDQDEET